MKIKLVIWDLDETLWHGTLADGDAVRLIENRAHYVRAYNQCGIASSLCSKNDPKHAKETLEKMGLWDQFVFPHLAFEPKDDGIRQIIENMQLLPANVLFVDDNVHNLQEAVDLIPELNVVNASLPECDALLAQILNENKSIKKSRLEEYRLLERKYTDRQQSSMSYEAFLRSSEINVALIYRADNMEFVDQIEDLINQSSQLNYTKSRGQKDVLLDLMATILNYHCYSVIVWDKYEYQGLVGFAVVDVSGSTPALPYFVFSSRIMNMGIDNWLLHKLKSKFPNLDISFLPIPAQKVDWIHQTSFMDSFTRAVIWKKQINKDAENIKIKILAACQSGALAHYSGLEKCADPENLSGSFYLAKLLDPDFLINIEPPTIVYAALSNFPNSWDEVNGVYPYEVCAIKFCEYIKLQNKKMLVILTPENMPITKKRDDDFHKENWVRLPCCNKIWRKMASLYPDISLLEVSDLAQQGELIDIYHYEVVLLKKIGNRIRHWFETINPVS